MSCWRPTDPGWSTRAGWTCGRWTPPTSTGSCATRSSTTGRTRTRCCATRRRSRRAGRGAGLRGHGDRRHDPQRGAHRRPARPARTHGRPSARTGCPARGQWRRPLDSGINGSQRGRHGSTPRAGSTSTPRGRCDAPASVAPAARSRRPGMQLAAEALDMVREPAIYPNPAAHCCMRLHRAVPGAVQRGRCGAGVGSALSQAAGERPAQAAIGRSHLELRQRSRTAAVGTLVVVDLILSRSRG